MHREYRTIQGDTWDRISLKVFNDEKMMHRLIQANPAHRYVVFFNAGVNLVVPEVKTPEQNNTFPWRQNG